MTRSAAAVTAPLAALAAAPAAARSAVGRGSRETWEVAGAANSTKKVAGPLSGSSALPAPVRATCAATSRSCAALRAALSSGAATPSAGAAPATPVPAAAVNAVATATIPVRTTSPLPPVRVELQAVGPTCTPVNCSGSDTRPAGVEPSPVPAGSPTLRAGRVGHLERDHRVARRLRGQGAVRRSRTGRRMRPTRIYPGNVTDRYRPSAKRGLRRP